MLRIDPNEERLRDLPAILAEAFLVSAAEIQQDKHLRQRVLSRIAKCPEQKHAPTVVMRRFPPDEATVSAFQAVGTSRHGAKYLTCAFRHLQFSEQNVDWHALVPRLDLLHDDPWAFSELFYLIHLRAPADTLRRVVAKRHFYALSASHAYSSQSEVALAGLLESKLKAIDLAAPFLVALRTILSAGVVSATANSEMTFRIDRIKEFAMACGATSEVTGLLRQLSVLMGERAERFQKLANEIDASVKAVGRSTQQRSKRTRTNRRDGK